jgi:hypothetical protein
VTVGLVRWDHSSQTSHFVSRSSQDSAQRDDPGGAGSSDERQVS